MRQRCVDIFTSRVRSVGPMDRKAKYWTLVSSKERFFAFFFAFQGLTLRQLADLVHVPSPHCRLWQLGPELVAS